MICISCEGRGEEEAFGRLVDLFVPLVTAATSAYVPTREVEHTVEDTFLCIWRNAPQYQATETSAIDWIMSFTLGRGVINDK